MRKVETMNIEMRDVKTGKPVLTLSISESAFTLRTNPHVALTEREAEVLASELVVGLRAARSFAETVMLKFVEKRMQLTSRSGDCSLKISVPASHDLDGVRARLGIDEPALSALSMVSDKVTLRFARSQEKESGQAAAAQSPRRTA